MQTSIGCPPSREYLCRKVLRTSTSCPTSLDLMSKMFDFYVGRSAVGGLDAWPSIASEDNVGGACD